jgi:hypothetical protein
MIFEINYNELQVPLMMIKELLTDKEYKGDVKQITFEVTKEKAMLLFSDDRLGVRMKVELDGAQAELPGVATCSFSSFFEMVKVFKKSEEPILVEREGEFIRVDDGVYPEEMLKLKQDETPNLLPNTELVEPLLGISGVRLRDGIQLASTIVRKTDIPADMIDTQAVYLGTEGDVVTFNSFSLHNFHRSKRMGTVYQEGMVQLTKPVASALAKIADVSKKSIEEWSLSSVNGEELLDKGILMKSADENISLFFTLSPLANWDMVSNTFKTVELNFKESMRLTNTENILNVTKMGKVKAEDNVVIIDGNAVIQASGYPAPLIKKLWEKGAWEDSGTVFYADGGTGAKLVLCLFDDAEGEEKMTTLSYREATIA